MDILQYPACKLYKNGSFRLPEKIKREFESRRYKKVVIIASVKGSCLIFPVSVWQKKKDEFTDLLPEQYPKYPQSISKTFLNLHLKLFEHLEHSQMLYFVFSEDYCVIYNQGSYQKMNAQERENLDSLYESF